MNQVDDISIKQSDDTNFNDTQVLKDYFTKLVDNTPQLATEFVNKFEKVKLTKRAYWEAINDFDKIHRSFFFHTGQGMGYTPLFWEFPSPDHKRQRQFD